VNSHIKKEIVPSYLLGVAVHLAGCAGNSMGVFNSIKHKRLFFDKEIYKCLQICMAQLYHFVLVSDFGMLNILKGLLCSCLFIRDRSL